MEYLEAKINSYGQEKLKNLAKYTNNPSYPIIHNWSILNSTNPRKYMMYFAMPDDRGNTFVIPAKWCEAIAPVTVHSTTFELNDNAYEQLSKAGKFPKEHLFPIIKIWEDVPANEKDKHKYDIFFGILDDDGKIFIVQSTWGKVILLDDTQTPLY